MPFIFYIVYVPKGPCMSFSKTFFPWPSNLFTSRPLTNQCNHSQLSKCLYMLLSHRADGPNKPSKVFSSRRIFSHYCLSGQWKSVLGLYLHKQKLICKPSSIFFLFLSAGYKGPHSGIICVKGGTGAPEWYGGLDHLLVQLTCALWPFLSLTPSVQFLSCDGLLLGCSILWLGSARDWQF